MEVGMWAGSWLVKVCARTLRPIDRYVPDLVEDKFHIWITEYHFVPTVILGLALFAIGGLPFLLWGIFLRTVVGHHSTWLVNSATQFGVRAALRPGIFRPTVGGLRY
jgi:sn-1 stearoyl-lipid 9-desaturase